MIRDKLNNLLNNNYQKDTQYIIAEYVIRNIDNIENISIYDIAKSCNTSTATISRFCRKIGFLNYLEFTDACVLETESLQTMTSSHTSDNSLLKNGLADLKNDINLLSRQMYNSLSQLPLVQVRKLIKDIAKYENIYFLGQSNSSIMYSHLQTELLTLKKHCKTITSQPGKNLPDTNNLSIIFSMHGHMIKHEPGMLEWAQSNSKSVWEISQVNKKSNNTNILYFGKCPTITADYMAWIYVADYIIYEYKKFLNI